MATESPLPTAGSSSLSAFARSAAPELLRFAYLLSGDRHRAEDLLQEVFLAMHRRFGDELPLDNPVGYARRALANHNISWARRASSTEVAVERVHDRPDVASADDVTAAAERDVLWQAMRRLPARQRTVLVLRYYADAADPEIADAIGCRRATVRSLAARGLRTLRDDHTLNDDRTLNDDHTLRDDHTLNDDTEGGAR
ncbi:RNA polymerase sigma-70 factor, sigma-E family [Jatrophihabitans endophyticus]|uniref:RNA polymerase sigma-70 factor, sigma-E family n=1 Tax=Jatrophihabitans endophyticus TaxID=1206085 RepID=A0A1M5QUQ4_9ACTN|nr:SigE family RNA polymerase sigma factor [Jatrophihabitans endophyticus]SHH17688.1 RNA polymerase sigma-70 factor, sigma-E family [Jatrophihabitans endophyticus]